MGVVMKGGTSGNREDALPRVSVPFDKQPPQNTASGAMYTNLQTSQNTGNREADASPPVPTCGIPDDSAT